MRIVTEDEFRTALFTCLDRWRGRVKSVSGPGRSGALAAVYASHYLGVPWLPMGMVVPAALRPVLVVDTAMKTGATLRRAARVMQAEMTWVFNEPPRIKFWYEREAWKDK